MINPIPNLEDLPPNNTAHDGSGTPEIKNDTGGNQIIERDWRDNILTADNRLPIPEKTTANNGLDVESNTKHTPGAPKVRLAVDDDGNIHRFSNSSKDGSGSYHWSGSTGDKNPLGHNELRKFNDIIKQLKAK